MERKIGETFEFEGKIYETIGFPSNSCFSCAFIKLCRSGMGEVIGNCCGDLREDKTDVFFKEIKKDMEIKDNKLTINIPDGMEIDLQNSNFDTGVIKFRKKELTYEDIQDSIVKRLTTTLVTHHNGPKSKAINKLMDIAKYYNGDWKPDWSNKNKPKFYIAFNYESSFYEVRWKYRMSDNIVYFKSTKDAQAVIDNPNFREILDAIYKN